MHTSPMHMLLALSLCVSHLALTCQCSKTFGISVKGQGYYTGHESIAFQRSCAPDEVPCTMQHYWSGGFFPYYGSSLLRYYVDGEKEASVVLPLGLAHGMASMMDVSVRDTTCIDDTFVLKPLALR